MEEQDQRQLQDLSSEELQDKLRHGQKVCSVFKNCKDGSAGMAASYYRIGEIKGILKSRGVLNEDD